MNFDTALLVLLEGADFIALLVSVTCAGYSLPSARQSNSTTNFPRWSSSSDSCERDSRGPLLVTTISTRCRRRAPRPATDGGSSPFQQSPQRLSQGIASGIPGAAV